MKVHLWHATVLGGVVGLLCGVALEIARQVSGENVHGTDILRPHAIPVATCVLFAALGSFVYVIWSQRK